MSLAVGSYTGLAELADGAELLNLAWTQDERGLLGADVMAVAAAELADEAANALPYLGTYMVRDPYGERELGAAVAEHFGLTGRGVNVTCGPGVGPLLHGLSLLALNGTVTVATDVYPDFPHWADRVGARCVPFDPAAPPRDGVLLLERPALLDDRFGDLDALRALCGEVAGRECAVVVDESNANYREPGYSAVRLAPEVDNLVVVRGLSKAYGLGGLRFGYCVSSAAVTERVRAVVPPLGAASVSLRLARRVLALGDVAGPLRERIAAHRRRSRGLLRAAAGLPDAVVAAEGLPYLLFPVEPRRALELLASAGIQGKLHPLWSASGGGPGHVARISVPLDEGRLAEFGERLFRGSMS